MSKEGVTAPLLALDNEAVLAENSHAWVLIEDFEDGIGDFHLEILEIRCPSLRHLPS